MDSYIFYLYTKFDDPSFGRFSDMIVVNVPKSMRRNERFRLTQHTLVAVFLLRCVVGLKNQQLQDRPVPSGQPSVAGRGALQASSIIGGYASLAAERPPSLENMVPPSQMWLKPYSDEHSTSTESRLSANGQSAEFQPDVPFEFPREKLYIRQKIGEGSFGEVWRARVDGGILGRTGEQLVAVKMLRGKFQICQPSDGHKTIRCHE